MCCLRVTESLNQYRRSIILLQGMRKMLGENATPIALACMNHAAEAAGKSPFNCSRYENLSPPCIPTQKCFIFYRRDSNQFCLLMDFYALETRSAMIISRCKTCVDCEADELQCLAERRQQKMLEAYISKVYTWSNKLRE